MYGKREETAPIFSQNQVGTCGISERRFIQGDRPEAGAELAMTASSIPLFPDDSEWSHSGIVSV